MSIHSFLSSNPILLLKPAQVSEPHNWVEHIPFAFFLTKMLKPNNLVELGVHTGNSFNAFCQVTKRENIACKCYGVDLWQGDAHAGFYKDAIYNTLRDQVHKDYPGIATLVRKDFNVAVDDFADNTIDILHIDGLHSYEAVKNDFDVWLSKISAQGVVLFHDTQVRERGFGVYQFWEEISSKYPNYEFKFGNGLGVLAVGKNVNPAFLGFLKEANQNTSIAEAFQFTGSKIFNEAEVLRLQRVVEKYEKKRQKYYYLTHPFLFVSRLFRGKL